MFQVKRRTVMVRKMAKLQIFIVVLGVLKWCKYGPSTNTRVALLCVHVQDHEKLAELT